MALVADPEATEVVQVRKAALDDPALTPEARSVRDAALGDHRLDAPRPQQPAVLDEVIAAVGEHDVGLDPRTPDLAGDRPAGEVIQQRHELCDVVTVAAGQRNGQWDAGRVD